MIPNKAHTTQFCDSYHSTKCHGPGNGRNQRKLTQTLRKQVNTRRRRYLNQDLRECRGEN